MLEQAKHCTNNLDALVSAIQTGIEFGFRDPAETGQGPSIKLPSEPVAEGFQTLLISRNGRDYIVYARELSVGN